MARPGSVVGWKLDRNEREELLKAHPPAYDQVVADHVTLKVDPKAPLPREVQAAIVGTTDDEKGVQAMVVTIDGSTNRPDGSTYHITWSLGDGRRAVRAPPILEARPPKGDDHVAGPG